MFCEIIDLSKMINSYKLITKTANAKAKLTKN